VTEHLALRAEGLSKRFKIYPSARARLADWLRIPRSPRYQEAWALRDVSFSLARRECLGIIGPNGAGKTTLLKLLTGVLSPTSGYLQVKGRVLSLLELGSDFNQDLTGSQNALESMRLLGVPAAEVPARLHDIESFAELGEYFDRAVKMYSSGMFVRLAFSIFSSMAPEIFLVDEALTVGDLRFAAKALARIREMRDRGTTLLFVSHDLDVVNQLCTRVLWIQAGKVQLDGPPSDVIAAYIQFMVHGGRELPLVARSAMQPKLLPSAVSTPNDHVQEDAGIALGQGWYALEAFGGDVFRWAASVAELAVEPVLESRTLLLDVEPAADGDPEGMLVGVDAGMGRAQEYRLHGRQTISIDVPGASGGPLWVRFLARDGGQTVPGDERSLSFRAFRVGWEDSGQLLAIQSLDAWRGVDSDSDLRHELHSMRAALARYRPGSGARARFLDVVTRNSQGLKAARFVTYDEVILELRIEAVADLPNMILGMELNDIFGRKLYWTRSNLQSREVCRLRARQIETVSFRCPRLLLGPGYYSVNVAVCGDGLENEIWQRVERGWNFHVMSGPNHPPFGAVDLDWRYCAATALASSGGDE